MRNYYLKTCFWVKNRLDYCCKLYINFLLIYSDLFDIILISEVLLTAVRGEQTDI